MHDTIFVGLDGSPASGQNDVKRRMLGDVTTKVALRTDRPLVIVPLDWTPS